MGHFSIQKEMQCIILYFFRAFKVRIMMENEDANTNDCNKKSEASAVDSAHADIKLSVDNSESKKVNISQNKKEARVEHILKDSKEKK